MLSVLFTERKSQQGDADQLPPSASADVKNMWSCFSTHPYIIFKYFKAA
jgi:hypothetical protein